MAVDVEGREISFGEYRAACLRTAARTVGLGVGPGKIVSWMLPTRIESMILVGALARLDAVQNPVLPIYRTREVRFIANQCEPALLVTPPEWRGFDYPAMAREIAAEHPGMQTLVVDRGLPEADDALLPPPPALLPPAALPIRWLFYTAGTTADPKGVQHTDASLWAAAKGMSIGLDMRPTDRVAFVFPFTHIGGINWLQSGLSYGCTHIIIENFAAPTTMPRCAKARRHPGLRRHRLPRGLPERPSQIGRESAALPGHASLPGRRCTEAAAAPLRPGQGDGRRRDPLGLWHDRSADPHHESLRRSVAEDGRDRGPDLASRGRPARGEGRRLSSPSPASKASSAARDRSSFAATSTPALDEAAFDEHGYFRTGDLGYLDEDGYCVVTGRLKDVIIRKGENIPAKEVEDLLYQHPKVADVAVIGLPDPKSGERCCAVVASKDTSDPIGFEEMQDYLRARS